MIGEQFGNYRAVSLLGEGGMGSVYLAEHPAIGRRVAVKVLHKNYTRDEHLLGRFLNEARAANAIRHPNIIEILDSGVLADGTPFLVMELLEGESLGTRLRNVGGLPISAALDFIYQTASALGAAHKKGIVHRDLKPDNLFIVPDPHDTGRERMKVLDFGIAKLHLGPSSDSVKTRTGTLMGTPIYMSPEQCRGTKAVDHRSDVYSLGVIFYEMLAGQTPFVSEGFGELVNMHLNVAPTSTRTHRPEIPPALDALVLKMLAKNPDDRFADMSELQGSLKGAGGISFPVSGSSPDLGRTYPPKPGASNPKLRDTTFSTGVGERLEVAGSGGKGKFAVMGIAAAAVIAGYFVLRPGDPAADGQIAPPKPIATATTAPPRKPVVTPPAPPPVAPASAKPAKVTLRLASNPSGAQVLNDGNGEVLGTTPLVLTRPIGGSIKLKFEKTGFVANAREIPLDTDHTVDLTLEQKKAKAKKPKRESAEDEPAKL
jgi:eukaryotic-like serine/threonine-protein kinase